MKNLKRTDFQEEQPPVLGTWNRLYAFVLILHAILIFGFYLLTQAYS